MRLKIGLKTKVKICIYLSVVLIVSAYITSAYITTITNAKENFAPGEAEDYLSNDDVISRIKKIINYNLGSETQSTISREPKNLSASKSIALDNATGRILFAKNEQTKAPMASTTKIMTFIIAVENCEDLYETVTVSRMAAYTEGSTMHLAEGETISLHDLLYGLMLNSGNDAAVAIAEHIAGSVDEFCQMMNNKASKLGAVNTNFKTPHGLDREGHYTTAYDLAVIAQEAYKQPLFRKIVSTSSITLSGHALKNTNPLLGRYSEVAGGKTGYTGGAGKCIVLFIETENLSAVVVLLGCPSSEGRVNDAVNVIKYITGKYKSYTLFERGTVVDFFAVEKGRQFKINSVIEENVTVTLSDEEKSDIKVIYSRTSLLRSGKKPTLCAPVRYSDNLGNIFIKFSDSYSLCVSAVAEKTVLRKTYTDHLGDMLESLPYVFN